MYGLRKAQPKLDLLGAAFALFAIAMLWSSPSWAANPLQDTVDVETVSLVDSVEMEADCG